MFLWNILMTNKNYARLSLAPMLDLTDRHFRYICRKLCKNMLLYTEMISTGAILLGERDHLKYSEIEHPISLQLGGGVPQDLAKCAVIAEERNYDEVNLNAGCPSDKVQVGSFGAILMRDPNLVADCVKAMKDVVDIPVTVKTRLGVDELNSYEYVCEYLHKIVDAGVDGITLHARQTFLKGMTPRENRDKPPLKYEMVYELKKEFLNTHISINGNVDTLEQALVHLEHVDGVMMGRSLYQNPFILSEADKIIYDDNIKTDADVIGRKDFIRSLYPYIEEHISNGGKLKHISRHLLGMFTGCVNARSYRHYMALHHHKDDANVNVLEEAMSQVEETLARVDPPSSNANN